MLFNRFVFVEFMNSSKLSIGAKGLLICLFARESLHQQWSLADISSWGSDTEVVVRRYLKELLTANFVLQTDMNYHLSDKAKTLQQRLLRGTDAE